MAEVPKMLVRLKASKSRALAQINVDEFDPEKHEKVEEGQAAPSSVPPPTPQAAPPPPEEPPRRR